MPADAQAAPPALHGPRTHNPPSLFSQVTPVTTLDTTPPAFINSTPASTDVQRTTVAFTVQMSKTGTVYWAMYPSNSFTPTTNDLISGTAAVQYGSFPINQAATATALSVTGLNPATCYDAFFGAQDRATPTPNRRPDPPAQVTVCTVSNTPPAFVQYKAVNMGTTSFDMSIELDKTGKVIYMVIGGAALCSTYTLTVDQVRTQQRPTADPLTQAGIISVNVVNQPVLTTVSPTAQATTYTIYMYAQDLVTPTPNVQPTTTCWQVTTPDLTPPTFSAAATARQATALTLTVTVSKPASVFWVLVRGCATVTTGVTPAMVMAVAQGTAAPTTVVDGASYVATGTALRTSAGPSVDINRTSLDAANQFIWIVTAQDNASPPNMATTVQQVPTSTLDIAAPVLDPSCIAGDVTVTDTKFTWNFTANKPTSLWYVLSLQSASAPTAAQIQAGQDATGATATVAGSVNAAGTVCTVTPCTGATCDNRVEIGNQAGEYYGTFGGTIALTGLTSATAYRLYVLVQDKASPPNSAVISTDNCPILAFSTLDLTPPVLQAKATVTAPSGYAVSVQANKVATAKWMLLPSTAAAPSPTQLWNLQDSTGSSTPFSGILSLPTPNQWVTTQGCGVQASQSYMLYVISQDTVQPTPNRNPSVLAVAATQVGNASTFASIDLSTCTDAFLTSALRPVINVAAGSPGTALGSTTGVATATRSRSFGLLEGSTPGTAVSLEVYTGGGPLTKSPVLDQTTQQAMTVSGAVATQPASTMSAVLRVATASPDAPVLSFRYLLKDADGQVVVGTAGLGTPSVELANSATGARTDACDAATSTFDPTTGLGTCTLTVPLAAFPAAGASAIVTTANVRVLYNGNTSTAVRSPALAVTLQPPPQYTTPTGAGITLAMPTTYLAPGARFTVTVTADSGGASLLVWSFPVYYDSSKLAFTGAFAVNSALWQQPFVVSQASSGYLAFNTYGRASTATASDTTGSALLLMTFQMQVLSTVASGTYANALRAGDAANPVTLVGLTSAGQSVAARPTGQINDSQGGAQTQFKLLVRAAGPVGLLAWASRPALVNTVVLDGTSVTTTLQAVVVSSDPTVADAPASSPTCSVASGNASVLSLSGCTATVASTNTAGSAAVPFTITASGLSATVQVAVYFPTAIHVTPSRTKLNKIIDLADPSLPSIYPTANIACTSTTYQATLVRVSADFTAAAANGAPLATVADVDITSRVTLASSDSSIVAVQGGSLLQGMGGPDTVTITASGASAAVSGTATVSTVAQTECLSSLEVVAYTSASLATGPPNGLFSPDAPTAVSVTPRQVLTQSGQQVFLRAYLVLADGTRVDVTPSTTFQSLDSSTFTVNAGSVPTATLSTTYGASAACGYYIRGTYAVCGAQVITGIAPARIVPAVVQGIATLDLRDYPGPGTRTVTRLTRTGDPAAAAPISVDTKARLRVLLSLSDGSTLDLSKDSRATFAITSGATLISLSQDASGYTVVTPLLGDNVTGVGSAKIQVTVTGLLAGAQQTVTVQVVMLQAGTLVLRDYSVGPLASGDVTSDAAFVTQPLALHKIDCATAYQQATVWAKAQLTDSTRYDVTAQATLTVTPTAGGALLANLGVAGLSNRLQPTQAGTLIVTATLGGTQLATVAVSVSDASPAGVASLTLSVSQWCTATAAAAGPLYGLCQSTLTGAVNSQATLEATVTLDTANYQTYTQVLGYARAANNVLPVPQLLSFTSSQPSQIAIATATDGKQYGDVTLLASSSGTQTVTLTARYACGTRAPLSATAQVYANLTPSDRDVDLGVAYGPQFQVPPTSASVTTAASVKVGDVLTVPVVLASPTLAVQKLTARVMFTGSAVAVSQCVAGPDAGSLLLSCDTTSVAGQVSLTLQGTSAGPGAALQLATLSFVAQALGSSSVTVTVDTLTQAVPKTTSSYPAVAAAGTIVVSASRRLLLSEVDFDPTFLPAMLAEHGAQHWAQDAGRALAQTTCTQAVHAATPGDVDGSCTFDKDDWLLLARARNYWNPGEHFVSASSGARWLRMRWLHERRVAKTGVLLRQTHSPSSSRSGRVRVPPNLPAGGGRAGRSEPCRQGRHIHPGLHWLPRLRPDSAPAAVPRRHDGLLQQPGHHRLAVPAPHGRHGLRHGRWPHECPAGPAPARRGRQPGAPAVHPGRQAVLLPGPVPDAGPLHAPGPCHGIPGGGGWHPAGRPDCRGRAGAVPSDDGDQHHPGRAVRRLDGHAPLDRPQVGVLRRHGVVRGHGRAVRGAHGGQHLDGAVHPAAVDGHHAGGGARGALQHPGAALRDRHRPGVLPLLRRHRPPHVLGHGDGHAVLDALHTADHPEHPVLLPRLPHGHGHRRPLHDHHARRHRAPQRQLRPQLRGRPAPDPHS